MVEDGVVLMRGVRLLEGDGEYARGERENETIVASVFFLEGGGGDGGGDGGGILARIRLH